MVEERSWLKMYLERNNTEENVQNLHDECRRLMSYHTIFTMKDGSVFDGIIESVEPDCVIVLVGEDVIDQESDNQHSLQRQFGPPRRFRRFRRRSFPLAALIALSLLQYPYSYYPF
ncbi:hypothetical protein [Metaclostridioides mangenotii]|uniref:Uncharacterized protein n=1 Tax=Metaclostridioides mangenotii TaxID=1540 RepID=A0ABS4EDR0_9FIRM|nr:hypothetical protein [Clostridioides mangenotii]